MELEFVFSNALLGNQSHHGDGDKAFKNLYPAVVQCFVIIFTGYIAGRTHILSSSQASGLGTYVSKFALPALLFKSMCTLKFGTVNWMFLCSIFVAKSLVFLAVALITFLLSKNNGIGKAGLFAIFTTQSNDFALGYPIVSALYGTSHPDFMDYLYLVAPISLAFLNPIGFTLLEVNRFRSSPSHRHTSWLRAWITIASGVLLNPIVFMTILGIGFNFVFHQKLPQVLSQVFQILGDSFSATALFYLGHSLVGKLQKQTGRALVIMGLLVTAKLLLLPLACRESTMVLSSNASIDYNATSSDFESFSFLYGTFPTAPTVFLYATHYDLSTDLIGTSLVVCTLVAAPVMVISAKMVTLLVQSDLDYITVLKQTERDVSITTICLSMWVLGVFALGKRCRSLPHQFSICLIISHVIGAIGVILYAYLPVNHSWVSYIQYSCLLLGTLSSQVWIAVIAVSVCMLHIRNLQFLLRYRLWLFVIGLGLPVWLTLMLVLLKIRDNTHASGSTAHGVTEISLTAVVLVISLVAMAVSLMILNRHGHSYLGPRTPCTSICEPECNTSASTTNPAESLMSSEQVVGNGAPGRITSDVPPLSSDDLSASATDIDALIPESPRSAERMTRGRVVRRSAPSSGLSQKGPYIAKSCSSCTGCGEVSQNAVCIEDLIPFPTHPSSDPNDALQTAASASMDNVSTISTVQSASCMEQPASVASASQNEQGCSENSQFEELQEDEIAVSESRDEHQIMRHVILILVLLLVIATELFASSLRFLEKDMSGVRVEIEFLNSFLKYGQGIFTFLVFGLDSEVVLSPVYRRLRRLVYGAERITLPSPDNISIETLAIRRQFVHHHREVCRSAITGCRRYRLKRYQNVFAGSELVNWLLEVGLANDRFEGVAYGEHLLLGGVIEHAHRTHHFHDLPYLYKFTTVTDTTQSV